MIESQDASKPSEESLLRAEADQARAALHGALLGIKNSLLNTADPKVWAQTHPWMSVGVAAATGFAAANAIVPARGERATDRWSGLIHRLAPHGQPDTATMASPASSNLSTATAPSMWTSVIDSLFELAKVAISNMITAMVEAKTTSAAVHDAMDSTSDQPAAEIRGD